MDDRSRNTFLPQALRFMIALCGLVEGVSHPPKSEAQPRGPIELPTDYPLTDTHLSIPSASPDTTLAGQQQFGIQLSWSNVSNYDDDDEQSNNDDVPTCDNTRKACYVVDAEVRRALLRYRLGLSENSEFFSYLPITWRGGGVLDEAVDQFHQAIGVSTGVRGQVPRDRYEIRGQDEDSSFNYDDEGLATGNIVVGFKQSVHDTKSSRTSLQALVSLPTSHGSYGHEGVDVAATLLHRESLSDFAFYLGGGPVIKSDKTHYGVDYRPVHGEGFVSIEYIYGPALSLIVGAHAATRIVDGIAGHPGSAAYLDTGLKTEFYGLEWELLFRENISSGSGSTDFTMMLGVNLDY